MGQFNLGFIPGGGQVITTSGTEATKTVRAGEVYRLSATTATAVRFGASAVAYTDGNFDFVVEPGAPVIIQVPSGVTTIRAIQVASPGTLAVQRIDEGA